MRKNQSVRLLLIAIAVFFFAALSSPVLQAERFQGYDLDSLVHLSTDIVEVEVIRRYEAHDLFLLDVKLIFPHKGSFKKGQTVAVAATDVYQKPKKGSFDSQPLAAGDRLVLFLVRVEPSDRFRIPKDAVIYSPLQGGIRLIQDDNVFGFSQWGNPGPVVANVAADPAKAKVETVERFREKVRDSLRDTPEWAKLLEAKQDKLDVPRLLKLLASRTEPTDGNRDYFSERISIRFAESRDPELLDKALALAKDYYAVSILQRGFGTPKGRDYLLAKAADATEPMTARLRCANALHHADPVYRSTLTEISTNSHRHVGEADEGNSGYITRVAKAARASAKHEELCGILVRCIDYFGQGIVQNKPAPLMTDMHGAFAVLKELYDDKPSQELQFRIEKAIAWDASDYKELKSPCGTFISILRRADPAKYTKPEKRSLIFEYEYSTLLLSRDAEVQPFVLLVHQGTRSAYVFPTKLRIRGWSTGGGSHSVVLPEDLPAGRYHLYFQISAGEKVISTGHYFAADL